MAPQSFKWTSVVVHNIIPVSTQQEKETAHKSVHKNAKEDASSVLTSRQIFTADDEEDDWVPPSSTTTVVKETKKPKSNRRSRVILYYHDLLISC